MNFAQLFRNTFNILLISHIIRNINNASIKDAMCIKNCENELFERIEIFENASIFYPDGNRETFDGIQISNNKVIFGRIKIIKCSNFKKNPKPLKNSIEVFVETGVIPESNIKKIQGGKKRLIYHKK